MYQHFIETTIGKIAVFDNHISSAFTPIIFLHGVYFDHHLWDYFLDKFPNRRILTLDMPMHGISNQQISSNWSLEDCSKMLIEILENLKLPKVVAIGHSWGSMSILRSASQMPELFESIGLCNMPYEALNLQSKIIFKFRDIGLLNKSFYIKKASESLFAKQSIISKPELVLKLKNSMSKMSRSSIYKTNGSVIINAQNTSELIDNLKIPKMALKGKFDYVPTSQFISTIIANGGHTSPLEDPDTVLEFCNKVLLLANSIS